MPAQGPAELVLTAAVARRHYLLNQSKTDIAGELGISRFKVARLLDAARSHGMVRIEIVRQGLIDVDASARLQERFALAHAVVVDGTESVGGDGSAIRAALASAAADLLAEVLTEGDVLGLPWSRNVHATVEALSTLPLVDVVQLTGAMVLPELDSSAVDIVRAASRVSGGRARVFYAPFVLDDAASADAIRRQPAVAMALGYIASVTCAVVGVGAWAPGLSTIHDMVTTDEQRSLAALGVVGEVSGICFDEAGRPVPSSLSDRLVALREKEFHDIPSVIAVVCGADRAVAVRAAINGGLVTSLVTDRTLAEALLETARVVGTAP